MSQLATHGLRPDRPYWKLFEVEGWQLLVAVTPDEDHETRWRVSLTANVRCEYEATLAIIAPREEVARQIFDAITDGPIALQGVFDQLRQLGLVTAAPDDCPHTDTEELIGGPKVCKACGAMV